VADLLDIYTFEPPSSSYVQQATKGKEKTKEKAQFVGARPPLKKKKKKTKETMLLLRLLQNTSKDSGYRV
jgi:hypothetical protein